MNTKQYIHIPKLTYNKEIKGKSSHLLKPEKRKKRKKTAIYLNLKERERERERELDNTLKRYREYLICWREREWGEGAFISLGQV